MRFEWQGWDDDDEGDEPASLGRTFTASEAEVALGIPATRIRKWAQRCERTGLYCVAKVERNYPLYWEADLIALSRGMKIRDERGFRVVFAVPA